MKRMLSTGVLLIFLFLSACSRPEYPDMQSLVSQFNQLASGMQIDAAQFIVQAGETHDTMLYFLTPDITSDIFLVKLYVEQETQWVSTITMSLTMRTETGENSETVVPEKKEAFHTMVANMICAYTGYSEDKAKNIISQSGLDTFEAAHFWADTAYRFSGVANPIGASFSIECIKLNPTIEAELSLREESTAAKP